MFLFVLSTFDYKITKSPQRYKKFFTYASARELFFKKSII